jgi:hypothetical protein
MVWSNEWIGGCHRVGVVHAPVITSEGDEAWGLAQAGLELRSDLSAPVL